MGTRRPVARFFAMFAMAFAGMFLITGAWAMANPLGAAPDEGTHATTAYATAHGDVADTAPVVPPTYAHLYDRESMILLCFHEAWDVSADCQDWAAAARGGPQIEKTQFGTYNPVYYALTGWPTLFLDGRPALYAIRLVSAALVSATFGAAVALAATRRQGRALAAGIVASTPPTAMLLAGSINVNALEIGAAVLVWTGFLLLMRDDSASAVRTRLTTTVTTVGIVLLLVSRLLSPLWLLAILGTVLIATGRWSRLWALIRRSRYFQAHLAIVAASVGYALWWTVTHPAEFIAVAGPVSSLRQGLAETAKTLMFDFWERTLPEAIAVIDMQSLRIYAAQVVFVLVWGGLLVTALLVTRYRRTRAGLLLLVAFSLVVPAVLEAFMWSGSGWQGRYSLPVLIGVGIVSTEVILSRAGRNPAAATVAYRGVVWATIVTAVTHLFVFTVNYQRFAAGWGQTWNPLDFRWNAPGGPWPWFLALTAGLVVLVMVVRQAARGDRPPGNI